MKYTLPYAEFYITNVCNLNCKNCNRFNNYKFKGHYIWDEYKDIYAAWGDKVNIKKIGIIGGEPLTHPDLHAWIKGIRAIWPTATIRLLTNGTLISKLKKLLPIIAEKNVIVEVSIHFIESNIIDIISNILAPPLHKEYIYFNKKDLHVMWNKAYLDIKDDSWPMVTIDEFDSLPEYIKQECDIHKVTPDRIADLVRNTIITDSNGVIIDLTYATSFRESSVIMNDNNLTLHNNNSNDAWSVCYFKSCHHFMEGKFYKCPPVALFNKFDNQIGLSLDNKDRDLINNYIPLCVSDDDTKFDRFINHHLLNSIPQCKFCTDNSIATPFVCSKKKGEY